MRDITYILTSAVVFLLLILLPRYSSANDKLFYITQNGAMACLARVMYEEANTQPYVGRKAVVEVVINRAIASNKHVCDIIRERSQFSWVNKNTNVYRLTDSKKSERDVLTITKEIVSGKQVLSDNTKFFYSKSLASPAWATKMDCIDIVDHTFCKQRVR